MGRQAGDSAPAYTAPACTAPVYTYVVNGKSKNKFRSVYEPRLKETGLQGEVWLTERRGHAIDLACRAAAAAAAPGGRAAVVVAVGGDGLLNEVVNGVLAAQSAAGPGGSAGVAVGLLPLGTGSDFARTLGWGPDPTAACARLAGCRTQAVDVGRLSCCSDAGLVERHFINMCTCGASAAAAVCLDRYRWAGRLGAYTLAAAEALLLRYKRQPALLRLDGGAWVRLRSLTLVAFGSGRYFGGGMMIAPGADPGSSTLQVVTADGAGLLAFAAHQGRLRAGTHLSLPWIASYMAGTAELEPEESGARLPVECDGELVGWAPLAVRVLPGALQFVV